MLTRRALFGAAAAAPLAATMPAPAEPLKPVEGVRARWSELRMPMRLAVEGFGDEEARRAYLDLKANGYDVAKVLLNGEELTAPNGERLLAATFIDEANGIVEGYLNRPVEPFGPALRRLTEDPRCTAYSLDYYRDVFRIEGLDIRCELRRVR